MSRQSRTQRSTWRGRARMPQRQENGLDHVKRRFRERYGRAMPDGLLDRIAAEVAAGRYVRDGWRASLLMVTVDGAQYLVGWDATHRRVQTFYAREDFKP